MGEEHFKHYILELAHRHLPLLTAQLGAAIPIVLAHTFVLIYLLKSGLNILTCALFNLLIPVAVVLLLAFGSRTIIKNPEHALLTSLIALGAYYLSLAFLPWGYFLLLAAPLYGLYLVLFRVIYNVLVMHAIPREHRGVGLGLYLFIFSLISVLMPLAGGLFIIWLGYRMLFILSFIICALNTLFVYLLRVASPMKLKFSITELLRSVKVTRKGILHIDLDLRSIPRSLRWALFAEGAVFGIFWLAVPLVAFSFTTSEQILGYIFSIVALTGALMVVFLGIISDRIQDRAPFIRLGAVLTGLFCIILAANFELHYFVLCLSLVHLTLPLVPSFLFALTVDALEAEKKKGVVIREFLLNSGRVVGTLICAVFIIIGWDLVYTFPFAGGLLLTICFINGVRSGV